MRATTWKLHKTVFHRHNINNAVFHTAVGLDQLYFDTSNLKRKPTLEPFFTNSASIGWSSQYTSLEHKSQHHGSGGKDLLTIAHRPTPQT